MRKVCKDQYQTESNGSQVGMGLQKAVKDNLCLICKSVNKKKLFMYVTPENYFLKTQMAISMQIIYTVGNQIIFSWL